MSMGLLPPLHQNEHYTGRRGLGSVLGGLLGVLTLITTEDFSNSPPSVSLVTTEAFSNDPVIGSLITSESMGGYSWNPNVELDALRDSQSGKHINVTMTLEQDDGLGSWVQVRSTPFGTILDLSVPFRDHRVTVAPSYSEWSEAEQKMIIYDATTTTLTYTASYNARTTFNFVYVRRAGQ